jgi:predicted metalloprotease with PDZ domain
VSAKPYRVFLRTNPVNPNGGVGLYSSFVATFDQNTKAKDLELLLAHEMLHTFAPSLDEATDRLMSTQWFSEGLAIYYQRLLPLRAGLIEPADFLEDLNQTAGRYYTNALNNTPNDQIAPRFWEDTRIRVLPYDRGSMYLAVVNAQIRKASRGRRSLDDLVFALLERQRQGTSNSPEVWIDLITKELGPAAKAEYESMLAGAVMLPESDAFGPCFERRSAKLRRFELGFDPKIMNQRPRIVRGLIPGSEAERAGLRDGDEITQPVGLDSVQEDQKRTLTLTIRREGNIFPVTYLPRGETADAYQWARVSGVPDGDCRR